MLMACIQIHSRRPWDSLVGKVRQKVRNPKETFSEHAKCLLLFMKSMAIYIICEQHAPSSVGRNKLRKQAPDISQGSGTTYPTKLVHFIWRLPDCLNMMTSSNGNIFGVTGPLCGEFTGDRWIPRTNASDAELWFFSLVCTRINSWVNNREAGDLRRHCAHYEVTVMNGRWEIIKAVSFSHGKLEIWKWLWGSFIYGHVHLNRTWHGLLKETRHSSALAIELRLSCTNPSIYVFLKCKHGQVITKHNFVHVWRNNDPHMA